MNTIESTGWHVKAFLNPYNQVNDCICNLTHYMFAAECRSENVDQFTKFIYGSFLFPRKRLASTSFSSLTEAHTVPASNRFEILPAHNSTACVVCFTSE
jgi:hypothetical protein